MVLIEGLTDNLIAKDNVGITVLIDSFFARTRINLVRQLPFSKFLLPFFVTKNVIEAHKKNLSITHAKLGR